MTRRKDTGERRELRIVQDDKSAFSNDGKKRYTESKQEYGRTDMKKVYKKTVKNCTEKKKRKKGGRVTDGQPKTKSRER